MALRDVLTHATINSIIGLAGLTLALFTAWHQFGPTPDHLIPDVEGRVDIGASIKVGDIAFPAFDKRKLSPVAGPVLWRAVLYNDLDRPVTVRSIKTLFLHPEGGLSYYSGLQATVLDGSSPGTTQVLPFVVKPREAKAIILALNIPVYPEDNEQAPCLKSDVLLHEIEKCFFLRNRDLFGNAVKATIYPNIGGKEKHICYLGRCCKISHIYNSSENGRRF
jgi:hypothetical protein